MLAIASREQSDTVRTFAEQLGLTMPVLLDEDGAVLDAWPTTPQIPTAVYPREWIIDPDGIIVYTATTFEHDLIVEVIERHLP